MHVSHLQCESCGSVLQGQFSSCPYCRLPQPLYDFLGVFLRNRGVIRDIEKDMGISYPAVKNRIDKLMRGLGFESHPPGSREEQREEILVAVRDGEMTVEGALEALQATGRRV